MGAQRVLVVDDDPDYRLLVRLALEPGKGFEVVAEAGDGPAAVAQARREQPDVVLLDCRLPGADAFDILPELRAAAPDARVVLVSGYDDEGDLTDAVTLLVSELVTNAVLHAGSDVEVTVQLTPTAARVEVTDASADAPAPRHAATDEDSGRGLALVGSLARRWGVRPTPGGGKTVWFEVDRKGAP